MNGFYSLDETRLINPTIDLEPEWLAGMELLPSGTPVQQQFPTEFNGMMAFPELNVHQAPQPLINQSHSFGNGNINSTTGFEDFPSMNSQPVGIFGQQPAHQSMTDFYQFNNSVGDTGITSQPWGLFQAIGNPAQNVNQQPFDSTSSRSDASTLFGQDPLSMPPTGSGETNAFYSEPA